MLRLHIKQHKEKMRIGNNHRHSLRVYRNRAIAYLWNSSSTTKGRCIAFDSMALYSFIFIVRNQKTFSFTGVENKINLIKILKTSKLFLFLFLCFYKIILKCSFFNNNIILCIVHVKGKTSRFIFYFTGKLNNIFI